MREIDTKKSLTVLAAAVAALPIFLATASFAQGYPPPYLSPTPQGDPPALVARIGYTLGQVSFLPAGAGEWSAAVNNYPMTSGDRLYCDQGSQAEIGAGSTDVRMWQDSDVTLTNLTDQYQQIGLANGSVRVRIYGINPGATVEVDTPNGSAVITQPGDYRFDVFSQNGSSDAVVNAGALQITGPDGLDQEVVGGQAVQMSGTNPIQLLSVNLPPFDALDQWSSQRDHQVLYSVSAQYVSRETPGYADLDAYGSWAPTPEYGPVWYPASVPYGWQPYSVGYWAYVAPWGYTWIDAEPWGYAPFHYGRWAVIQGRWGWVPGPPAAAPVYSPALVAFVGGPGVSIGSGGGVAAWFPLGVGEPFVPWYHASPAYARQVNVTNVNITNIHNTTIVNNYNTYISNTRTVNNITQINTNNIQYANRAQVTAVPANATSSGHPVAQTAMKLTPAMQQQLAAAPVHYAPSAPAPTHTLLTTRPNVKAPVGAPTLVTPRGMAKATPAANPAKLAPVNLPKPQPAAALPKPVAGAVAGRPATAQPAAARTAVKTAAPEGQPPATRPPANSPLAPRPAASQPEKATPATASRPIPGEREQRPPAEEHPAPSKPAEPRTPQPEQPATESQPRNPTPPVHPPAPPTQKTAPPAKPKPPAAEQKPQEEKPQ